MRRLATRVAVIVLSGMLLLSLLGGSALAASHRPDVPLAQRAHDFGAQARAAVAGTLPNVICSGNGCNDTDPYATGCAAHGFKDVADVSDGYVIVELDYSYTCGTNWTQVYRVKRRVGYASGCVARRSGPDGGPLYTCYSSSSFSWINTNQVYARDNLAQACGNGGVGLGICTPWY